MSRYNANGGQRRSSKIDIPIPDTFVKCRLCETRVNRFAAKELKQWEMQHMHLDQGALEFMTCSKCKLINPMKMLEKIGVKL